VVPGLGPDYAAVEEVRRRLERFRDLISRARDEAVFQYIVNPVLRDGLGWRVEDPEEVVVAEPGHPYTELVLMAWGRPVAVVSRPAAPPEKLAREAAALGAGAAVRVDLVGDVWEVYDLSGGEPQLVVRWSLSRDGPYSEEFAALWRALSRGHLHSRAGPRA